MYRVVKTNIKNKSYLTDTNTDGQALPFTTTHTYSQAKKLSQKPGEHTHTQITAYILWSLEMFTCTRHPDIQPLTKQP